MVNEEMAKNMINESSYLKNLYDLYNLIDKLTDSNLEDNLDLLRKLEDSVYTVNNKVLSDQEKLSLEIKKIIRANEKNMDFKSKEIISKKLQNILDIMDEIFDKSIDEQYILDSVKNNFIVIKNDVIFNMKKKISILESELDVPINFFEAATCAFLDIYKKYYNAYNKSYSLEKKVGGKYEYI